MADVFRALRGEEPAGATGTETDDVLGRDAPRRLMIPVDLRRHDPVIASTGNLSLPVFLDTRAGENWAAPHTRLLQALRDNREVVLGAAEKAAYRLPARALGPRVRASGSNWMRSARSRRDIRVSTGRSWSSVTTP